MTAGGDLSAFIIWLKPKAFMGYNQAVTPRLTEAGIASRMPPPKVTSLADIAAQAYAFGLQRLVMVARQSPRTQLPSLTARIDQRQDAPYVGVSSREVLWVLLLGNAMQRGSQSVCRLYQQDAMAVCVNHTAHQNVTLRLSYHARLLCGVNKGLQVQACLSEDLAVKRNDLVVAVAHLMRR